MKREKRRKPVTSSEKTGTGGNPAAEGGRSAFLPRLQKRKGGEEGAAFHKEMENRHPLASASAIICHGRKDGIRTGTAEEHHLSLLKK